MSDYRPSGPLRLYRFLSAPDEIEIITYDTTRREIVTSTRLLPDPAFHPFSIPFPVRSPYTQR